MKKWITLSATIVLTLGIAISVQKSKALTTTARAAAADKPDLIVDRFELLHQRSSESLAQQVQRDIESVSSMTPPRHLSSLKRAAEYGT